MCGLQEVAPATGESIVVEHPYSTVSEATGWYTQLSAWYSDDRFLECTIRSLRSRYCTVGVFFSLFADGNCSRSWPLAAGKRLGDCEVAISAVRDYSLTRRQPELFSIELHQENVGFE